MNLTYQFTRLLVSNFKACFIFYRDILGFTPIYGTEDEVYADFDCGPVNISLFDKYLMNKAIGNEDLPVSSQEQDKVCQNSPYIYFTSPRGPFLWIIRAYFKPKPDG